MSINYTQSDNSSSEMKKILDKNYNTEISFPSNQIDAILGFFLKRGYSEQASKSLSIILLNQARIDNVNVFELLDRLVMLSDAQLTEMIASVANIYRDNTSYIGYKITTNGETLESRNVLV